MNGQAPSMVAVALPMFKVCNLIASDYFNNLFRVVKVSEIFLLQ
jgi:hypothetical protein